MYICMYLSIYPPSTHHLSVCFQLLSENSHRTSNRFSDLTQHPSRSSIPQEILRTLHRAPRPPPTHLLPTSPSLFLSPYPYSFHLPTPFPPSWYPSPFPSTLPPWHPHPANYKGGVGNIQFSRCLSGTSSRVTYVCIDRSGRDTVFLQNTSNIFRFLFAVCDKTLLCDLHLSWVFRRITKMHICVISVLL